MPQETLTIIGTGVIGFSWAFLRKSFPGSLVRWGSILSRKRHWTFFRGKVESSNPRNTLANSQPVGCAVVRHSRGVEKVPLARFWWGLNSYLGGEILQNTASMRGPTINSNMQTHS